MVAASRGEISLSEAKAYIDLLERFGGMQGYIEIEKLRTRLESINPQYRSPVRAMDQSHLPEKLRITWGQGTSMGSDAGASDR